MRTSCLALLSLFVSNCHLPTIAARPPLLGGAHRQKPELWIRPVPSGTPAPSADQKERLTVFASHRPLTMGPRPKPSIGKWGFYQPPGVRKRYSPMGHEDPIIGNPPG